MKVMGYEVIENTAMSKLNFPYFLRHSRGARYMLMRNKDNPNLLFAINERKMGDDKVTSTWFFEKDGIVKLVSKKKVGALFS